ncbi:hypothetical protein AGR4C_pb30072 [Agrobacterium tumefaciens str. Kerr 14]|uniref:Uncharacterized protein n=1 Tax=Agrobacterium tumefaciens str. Kerr 14 TaxID=1183424 RepID=A0A1S7SG92_AGRTU|nr:hypothetical protein AGR4C_pb30072 [Agrobacterium tumefaciens str. Kerr 14]
MRDATVFPVVDLLLERSVPFVFTTGYRESIIPSRFASVVRGDKPLNVTASIHAIPRCNLTLPLWERPESHAESCGYYP